MFSLFQCQLIRDLLYSRRVSALTPKRGRERGGERSSERAGERERERDRQRERERDAFTGVLPISGAPERKIEVYRGTSLMRKRPPPRTTIGPWA